MACHRWALVRGQTFPGRWPRDRPRATGRTAGYRCKPVLAGGLWPGAIYAARVPCLVLQFEQLFLVPGLSIEMSCDTLRRNGCELARLLRIAARAFVPLEAELARCRLLHHLRTL